MLLYKVKSTPKIKSNLCSRKTFARALVQETNKWAMLTEETNLHAALMLYGHCYNLSETSPTSVEPDEVVNFTLSGRQCVVSHEQVCVCARTIHVTNLACLVWLGT